MKGLLEDRLPGPVGLAGAAEAIHPQRERAQRVRAGVSVALACVAIAAASGAVAVLGRGDLHESAPARPAPAAAPVSAAPLVAASTTAIDESRLRVPHRVYEQAMSLVYQNPEWLSGAWFSTAGSLVVGAKPEAPARVVATIKALGPHVEVAAAGRSLDELQAIAARFPLAAPPPGLAGNLVSVGIDGPNDRVVAGLVHPDLAARQTLARIGGDAVAAEQSGPGTLQ